MTGDEKQTPHDVKARGSAISRFDSALDFMATDHMRKRQVCAMIDKIASTAHPDQDDCGDVVSFLKNQLPQHMADEEIDLFPMMLKRCEPEDEIQKVIEELKSDHKRACSDTPAVIALIEAKALATGGFSKDACVQMHRFAAHARRHLSLEIAIILPIARARLTKKDMEIMKHHMLERRGLIHRSEGPKC
jgi:hemerythrin-like domain-containing protein